MITAHSTEEIRSAVRAQKQKGRRIGFVPTMGYLHQGHLSLIEKAKELSDCVVASVFVNPTQFNDKRDFEKYPVDIPRDSKLLESVGTEALFLPSAKEIYAEGFQSWVELSELPLKWEGAFRPGHFKGVSTVVSILFNAVMPDIAVFGEKDFQQLRIIERMVEDLKFSVRVVRGETVRESSGLAMSSRNVRLSAEGREIAANIHKSLLAARDSFKRGERDLEKLRAVVTAQLVNTPQIEPEYVAIVDEATLAETNPLPSNSRALIAAKLEGVRLIDNLPLYS